MIRDGSKTWVVIDGKKVPGVWKNGVAVPADKETKVKRDKPAKSEDA